MQNIEYKNNKQEYKNASKANKTNEKFVEPMNKEELQKIMEKYLKAAVDNLGENDQKV